MKKHSAIYERNLLISVNSDEIGVFRAKLYGERINNKIIVLVLPKSNHNLVSNIDNVITNINSEIFKRIKIDMIKNVDLILFDNGNLSKVVFDSNKSLSEYHIENIEPYEIQSLEY